MTQLPLHIYTMTQRTLYDMFEYYMSSAACLPSRRLHEYSLCREIDMRRLHYYHELTLVSGGGDDTFCASCRSSFASHKVKVISAIENYFLASFFFSLDIIKRPSYVRFYSSGWRTKYCAIVVSWLMRECSKILIVIFSRVPKRNGNARQNEREEGG